MRLQSSDTNPKIEEKLIELIKSKSVSERLQQMINLSSFAINLSKRAIKRANPTLCKLELDLLFVKYNYGEVLFNKLNKYLKQKQDEEK